MAKEFGLRARLKLYITEHVRRLLALNFIVGVGSLICDIIGLLNLSFTIALVGLTVGIIDFIAGSYLVLIHFRDARYEVI